MPLDLTEKQKMGLELLQDPDKQYILFTGGSRSGKTYLIMEFLVGRAFQFPGSRQLIVRKNLVDARNSIWDDSLPKYLSQYVPSSQYTLMKSELKVEFANGSVIVLGGLDDEERSQKVLGTEYITIFCNEATQMSYDVIGMLRTRMAQKVYDTSKQFVAVNKMILDCNPRHQRHWLYIWGVQFKDPSKKPATILKDADKHATLHWTPYDNRKYLPEGYIETLDALPDIQRQRMLLGKWCGGEGQIFTDFNEAIHTCEPFTIPPHWSKYRAIDFGFKHPFAFCCGAYDYATDILYIYKAYEKPGITINDAADILNEFEREHRDVYEVTWSDHDAGNRAVLRENGIETTLANKNVTNGINSIAQRLKINPRTKKPRLIVFKDQDILIDQFYSYAWHESNSEVTDKESPIKINDDAMDCTRYISYGVDKLNGTQI